METIKKMIDYINKRDKDILITCNTDINIGDLSSVIIEILSWLRLEHKRRLWMAEGRKTCYKSLEIDVRYPWCAHLKMLVEKEKLFRDCFVIKDGKFDFADSVTEEEKMRARETVYNDYNPPRHVLIKYR